MQKLSEWKAVFCRLFFCKKNIGRDFSIIAGMILISFLIIVGNIPRGSEYIPKTVVKEEQIAEPVLPIEEDKIAEIQSSANFDGWKIYSNQWYGFEIKYPENWQKPIVQKALRGSKWAQKYQFRKNKADIDSAYIGYDVVIYNLGKIKNVEDTEEFMRKAEGDFSQESDCWQIEGGPLENENFQAERIYIPLEDKCYETTFFYNLVREEYIYNIIPVSREGGRTDKDPRNDLLESFPEFFLASKTLNLIDIKRPKPIPAKPRITAPMPYAYDKVGGKRVCNKKNDRPSKSKNNNKKGHMDMECCLDPDETPNPNCYYSPSKYGKYL